MFKLTSKIQDEWLSDPQFKEGLKKVDNPSTKQDPLSHLEDLL